MDVESWARELRGDIEVIERLLAEMEKVTVGDDAKLQHLQTQINSKLASPINRANRLHPYYLVYIDNHGEVVANHTDVKHLLDLARAACRGRDEPVSGVCRLFNRATDDGRAMDAYSVLLDQAIRSIVTVQEERDIDGLFSSGPTTALTNPVNGLAVAGLDDFELMSFLVVQATA